MSQPSRTNRSAVLLTLLLTAPALAQEPSSSDEAAHPGKAIFEEQCMVCHRSSGKSQGPHVSALKKMDRSVIEFALTEGKMQEHAADMDLATLTFLLDYLALDSGATAAEVASMPQCSDKSIDTETVPVGGWGLDSQNARFQPHSTIDQKNVGRLELAWAFGVAKNTEMRSQPVITEDTIFLLAVKGSIFALDRTSGCVKWHSSYEVPLRTSLSTGTVGGQPALFFGDMTATVHAISAHTGEPIWTSKVGLFDDSMTTGSVVQHGDRLYVPLSAYAVALAANPQYECCKSHGAVHALDAATGEILWTTHMTEDAKPTKESSAGVQQWGPSGAPVWTTPTIDAKRSTVYVGTGENTSSPWTELSDAIVALDMATGEIKWSYQATERDAFNMNCGFGGGGPNCPEEKGPDFDFGASVILTQVAEGKDALIAGQKSGMVHALDPDDGSLLWQRKLSDGTALGGVHWGMAANDESVFVPISDPEFPFPDYTPKPGLHALDKQTGEIRWTHRAERGCEANLSALRNTENAWPDCSYFYGFSAAATATNDLVFAGALDGKAYAFSADSGEILWQYDTKREFETVNGVEGHGGAIDNPGIQVVGDMVYLQSGYSMFGQMPGNVLLAFRIRSDNTGESR